MAIFTIILFPLKENINVGVDAPELDYLEK